MKKESNSRQKGNRKNKKSQSNKNLQSKKKPSANHKKSQNNTQQNKRYLSNSAKFRHAIKSKHSVRNVKELWQIEADLLSGLASFAVEELQAQRVKAVVKSETQVIFSATPEQVLRLERKLRIITALNRVLVFNIPRPKALLGNEQFTALTDAINSIKEHHSFMGIRLEAAGRDSSVFQRLTAQLEESLQLPCKEDGDLRLRFRPAQIDKSGWEVLVRTKPLPLSARPWRVCNMAGGLNACVAAATLRLAKIKPSETYLNAMCGSGTLLIEHILGMKQRKVNLQAMPRAWGVDISPDAIACSKENIAAAGVAEQVRLELADATFLDLPQHTIDVVISDVPWGDAVGSVAENAKLYKSFLQEMARVIKPTGRLFVITHDIKQFETCLKATPWQVIKVMRMFHGGHYPRLYWLEY